MIKRYFKSVLGQMFVLLGVAAMVACSSEKDEIVDNPNFNKETGEVNTQFVFSVSTGNETTRQSSGTAQANPAYDTFRGIENVNILTYKLGSDGGHLSEPAAAAKVFDLSTILLAGQISEADQRRVIELSLPLNTNAMMFYGKAIKEGTERSNGSIDYYVSGNSADTYFRLKKRLENEELLKETVALLESVFSRLVEGGLHKETTGDNPRDFRYAFSWPGESGTGDVLTGEKRTTALGKLTDENGSTSYADGENTIYVGSMDWRTLGKMYSEGESLTPLEEILGSTYSSFTGIRSGEIRGGSTWSVLRAVNDVMIANEKVALATPTGPAEKIAQLLAERLDTRFDSYFEHNTTGGLKFKDVSDVTENLHKYTGADKALFSQVTNDALTRFPISLNLPMGAAQLDFDTTTGLFTYKKTSVTLGLDNEGTNLNRLMWPAELCYFGNSPLRISDASKVHNDYPATVGEWRDDSNASWVDFKKDYHVTASTRAVAMQNDINYGSSLLESKVTIVERYLEDNGSTFNEYEGNKMFDANNSGLFTLSGILIGGQNNEMGWDYLRKYEYDVTDEAGTAHSSNFNYVIYDNSVGTENSDGTYSGLIIPQSGGTTAPNYTLVFDNYNSILDKEEQSVVYVALELVNNTGQDFYGEQGLVRNGGTFYIVGKLDPTAATNKDDIIFPSGTGNYHPLPPYDSGGNTIPAKRVFIQDYMTTAEFQINKNSLQHAFVTVPDLRATNISLGMSVDLKWTPGLDFKVIVGQ